MGIRRKRCEFCGKEFEGEHNRVYCCDECKKQGYREKDRRKRAENKRKRKSNQELTDVAALAKEAGMTYGQYVARIYGGR